MIEITETMKLRALTQDLHIKVQPWLRQAIERKAKADGIRPSAWARKALMEAVEK